MRFNLEETSVKRISFSDVTRLARWSWVPLLLLTMTAATALAQDDDDSPWAPGRNWLSVRAGFAKSNSEGAGNGFLGYGFGFTHMMGPSEDGGWRILKNFGLSFYVQHDVIGRFDRAMEIALPATVELTRYFNWGPTIHPYVGIGGGAVYRKTYRTGDDLRTLKPAYMLSFGANSPVSARGMLGLDVRLLRVDGVNDPPNPVFGIGSYEESSTLSGGVETIKIKRETTHWGVKLGYSLVY